MTATAVAEEPQVAEVAEQADVVQPEAGKKKGKNAFQPVEFWNAHEPNERILLEDAKDPAARRFISFFAGYFRANTPEEVAAVERSSVHARRANMPESIQCDKCGWSTKNSQVYQYHYQQHP